MTDAQEALVDVQWLKREAAHCRRMDYAEPAERYERIAAALVQPPLPVGVVEALRRQL